MAGIEVRFEGVMLFVLRSDWVEVLIPNAESGLRLPSGEAASPHYAWLTATTGAKYTLRESLIGTEVRFSNDADTSRPTIDPSVQYFNVDPIIKLGGSGPSVIDLDPTVPEDRIRLACRIILKGGELVGEDPPVTEKLKYQLDYNDGSVTINDVSSAIKWKAPAGVNRLTMTVEPDEAGRTMTREIDLPDGLYTVSHLDSRTYEGFRDDDLAGAGSADDDFRWLYHLIPLTAADWSSCRLSSGPRKGKLPAPYGIPDAAKFGAMGVPQGYYSPGPRHCMGALINIP